MLHPKLFACGSGERISEQHFCESFDRIICMRPLRRVDERVRAVERVTDVLTEVCAFGFVSRDQSLCDVPTFVRFFVLRFRDARGEGVTSLFTSSVGAQENESVAIHSAQSLDLVLPLQRVDDEGMPREGRRWFDGCFGVSVVSEHTQLKN
jgi:hypothetical protein